MTAADARAPADTTAAGPDDASRDEGGWKRPLARDVHEAHRVATPLELLFDLCFVVAIAICASTLHHGLSEHPGIAVIGNFLFGFFGIWWAWMNFSWFSSAYDCDDWRHRLLTMVQMVGAAIFAVGVADGLGKSAPVILAGYLVMRVALAIQWLRAAGADPERRRVCLRYAFGIAICQALWMLRHALIPQVWQLIPVLILLELAVPVWAERAHSQGTPWHAHHISERYSLFVIIAIGELVLGTVNSLSGELQSNGFSIELGVVGLGSMGLVFSLWWVYFLLPSAEPLHHHRERAFGWGYGHFALFASIAAMGAGMELVADHLKGADEHAVSPLMAISAVAIPEAIFVFMVWALHAWVTRMAASPELFRTVLVVLAAIAVVVVAVGLGLSVAWGLLLLNLGPIYAIVRYQCGVATQAPRYRID